MSSRAKETPQTCKRVFDILSFINHNKREIGEWQTRKVVTG